LQVYIDKCESWLVEAVQGSTHPKFVAVHIMILAHYWEVQVLMLWTQGCKGGLSPASATESQTASLQEISKIQWRIRGLAKQLHDMLLPSWMPAVVSLHKIQLPLCA